MSVVKEGAPAAPLNKMYVTTHKVTKNAAHRKLDPEGEKSLIPCFNDGRADLGAVGHVCIGIVRAKQSKEVSKFATFNNVEALMGCLSGLIVGPSKTSPGHSLK